MTATARSSTPCQSTSRHGAAPRRCTGWYSPRIDSTRWAASRRSRCFESCPPSRASRSTPRRSPGKRNRATWNSSPRRTRFRKSCRSSARITAKSPWPWPPVAHPKQSRVSSITAVSGITSMPSSPARMSKNPSQRRIRFSRRPKESTLLQRNAGRMKTPTWA